GRPGGHRGRGPRGPGALEGPAPRRLAPARPDRPAGRRDAGPEPGLVRDPAEPPQRARTRPAPPGGAGGRLRPLEWPAARTAALAQAQPGREFVPGRGVLAADDAVGGVVVELDVGSEADLLGAADAAHREAQP